MPKTNIKLKTTQALLPKFEIEYVHLGMLRSILRDRKPFGKFIALGDDKYIYAVSNTTGKAELEGFFPGMEKQAEKWLNSHE